MFGDDKVWGRYYGAGHTGGDAVYSFEKANVVHGGDLLFFRAHPNIDLPAGASAVNWIPVLEKMTRAHDDDTIYVFGHGKERRTRPQGRHALFRNYLTAAVDHARKGLAAGQSKEEIQKIDVLQGFEDVQSVNARLTLPFVARHLRRRALGQEVGPRHLTPMKNTVFTSTLLAAGALAVTLAAQAPPPPTPVQTANRTAPARSIAWRSGPIGPATPSGRVDDFAVLESDPSTFYVATATAGVYKTTNHGTTFTIGVRPRGQRRRWATSPSRRPTPTWCGSAPARTTTARARRGATASTSPPTAAATWKNMGLRDSKQIARIIVDPVDFNVVYVAALGDLWAAGGERGVYKTTDGGLTWQRVLFVDDDTGATELVMDPAQQQDALRRDLSAAPRAVGHERRRPGQRHLEVHRRRPTWTKLETGHAGRPQGPHRPGRLPQESRTSSTRASSTRPRAASIASRQRRRHVAEDERHQPAADVLQPDPHRSADRLAHLRARRLAAHLR